jgi:rhodanese-related sulfurtransferase
MQHITPQELRSKLDREGQELLLLDARGDETYAKEHIPHAKSAPETALRERVDGLVEHDTEIVVYCNNEDCSLSENTARGLEELGYHNVVRVPAGIDGWKDAGFDIVSN